MNIPTPELTDIAKKTRDKLEPLLAEKSVLGYAFSYAKLHKLISNFLEDENEIAEAIGDCVAGVDEASIKSAKDDINDRLKELYANNDIKSLRSTDPFGRRMDFLMYETSAPPRLSKEKLVEYAPSLGISTKKIIELLAKATTPGKDYTTMVARAVKEQ